MSGYPLKITRAALGPTYENVSKITNPKRQVDAAILNLMAWQLAGLNGTGARGLVLCTLSVSTITVEYQWFAWDPNQSLDKMEFTYNGIGDYSWELPGSGSYPDANGNDVPAALIGAVPFVQGTANRVSVANVDVDGISGSMHSFAADTGGVSDLGKWLMFFF